MESLWRKETKGMTAKAWKGPEKYYDVIVIGAGMAGLLIAYYLKEAGKKVLVLEAKAIASGQTERTTAKITSQHGLKYAKLVESVGIQKAQAYARANEAAIKEFESLIRMKKIDCQYEQVPAYLYSCQEKECLEREAKTAASLGIHAYFTEKTELPFPVTGAVCFENQAQFEPLEFMEHIARELDIMEYTKVIAVRGNKAVTKDREFTAKNIVFASHYPFRNMPGFYFLRQHQERSYVLALSGCKKIKGMYYGIDEDGLSFRQAGEYLLLGGCSRRTGEQGDRCAYGNLLEQAKQYFPDCKMEYSWSAQDCMPHDGIPLIGKYSVFTPHLYVATGFQKWGMTSSMISAMIIRDELCGMEHPYARLFSPQRINLRAGIGNFCTDVAESTRGLGRGFFGKNVPQCSHLGCGLKWNREEETWECPCHGSRFDEEGKLLDNPAKYDIIIKK